MKQSPTLIRMVASLVVVGSLLVLGRCNQVAVPGSETTSEIGLAPVTGAIDAASALGVGGARAAAGTPCPTVKNSGTGGVGASGCAVTASPNALTLTFAGCSYQKRDGSFGTAKWTGGTVFTSDSGTPVACGVFPGTPATGQAVTRTAQEGTAVSLIDSNGYSHRTVIDTTTASGFSTPVSGGVSVIYTTDAVTNSTTGALTVNIQGLHLTATKSKGNVSTPVWDHTVSTTAVTNAPAAGSPLTVVVTRTTTAGVTTVTYKVNGILVVQRNTAKEIASQIFTDVIYKVYDSSSTYDCPFPISGSTKTTFSGSTDEESLSFPGTTCGEAKLTNRSGGVSKIALVHAF